MVQRDMSFEEEQFLLCKQSGKKSQVLPDSPKDALSAPSVCQFTLDENYLIDPQMLYVGSKIGEGAHGKVYEGKYRDQSVAVKILKMDNLLLTADQKSVKLTDFGLAREESLTEMMTAETGTYRWMAPELYSTVTLRQGEKKHYNLKVDVYSFSIVLWELLTNRMPFEGMSNLQAAYAAAFKQVRPGLPDDLHQDLAFILQSCWAEDPNIRPNFGQIIRMLNTFLFTLRPQPQLVTIKSTESLKDSLDARLVRTNASEDGSIGAAARAKRRFSCFGQCFSSAPGEDYA